MVALVKKDANQIIEEKYKYKDLKYKYKVNTNILIEKLKPKLILMLAEKNRRKRAKILEHIGKEISRNVILIRTKRSFKRKNKSTQMVNKMNQKRSM